MWSLLDHERRPGIYFLLYHKVTGELDIEIDLPWHTFRRQMEFLGRTGRVVSYERAIALLNGEAGLRHDMYVLTFDDGFRDFYTHAFPLLQQLTLPAMLFVSTAFVEDRRPCILSTPPSRLVEPVTWEMLREMTASGLVSLGAHGHEHAVLPDCAPAALRRELARPQQLCEERLGTPLRDFAYPRGRHDARVRQSVAARYRSAAAGGFGKATPEGFDPYVLPRVPVLRRDGWAFFRAKLRGWLEQERRAYASRRPE